MHDIVIRGGNVVDGSGGRARVADIAIDDDRWLLEPGLHADVNAIDGDRASFGHPRMAWDLPGGATRLVQQASGYRHTFCAGVETVVDDEFTGALPGRLVRGPR